MNPSLLGSQLYKFTIPLGAGLQRWHVRNPHIREIIYGIRRKVRSYDVISDPEKLPTATKRSVMANLLGNLRHELGSLYGMRTWIECGFMQIKNELGWDHRLTDYATIER